MVCCNQKGEMSLESRHDDSCPSLAANCACAGQGWWVCLKRARQCPGSFSSGRSSQRPRSHAESDSKGPCWRLKWLRKTRPEGDGSSSSSCMNRKTRQRCGRRCQRSPGQSLEYSSFFLHNTTRKNQSDHTSAPNTSFPAPRQSFLSTLFIFLSTFLEA